MLAHAHGCLSACGRSIEAPSNLACCTRADCALAWPHASCFCPLCSKLVHRNASQHRMQMQALMRCERTCGALAQHVPSIASVLVLLNASMHQTEHALADAQSNISRHMHSMSATLSKLVTTLASLHAHGSKVPSKARRWSCARLHPQNPQHTELLTFVARARFNLRPSGLVASQLTQTFFPLLRRHLQHRLALVTCNSSCQ